MGSPRVTVEWSQAFYQKLKHPSVMYSFIRGPPVDLARQQIAENLLKSEASWLFFVDSDIVLGENTLMKLLSYNVPIISGLYWRRHPPLIHPGMWKLAKETSCPTCGTAITPRGKYNPVAEYPKNAVVEVDATGMGCCLIRKRVFERLKEIDPTKRFFSWTQGWEEGGVSEDFFFCQRAIDAGFRVLVDTSIICPHIMEAKLVEDGKLEGFAF